MAASNRNWEVLRALVELGGVEQLRMMNEQNLLPMHFAAMNNPNVQALRVLVELGGVEQLRATDEDGMVPMHLAAQFNPSAEVLRVLVELGGMQQLLATDENDRVPLHLAAQSNSSLEVIRYLLGIGCDRNPCMRGGLTPLQLAALDNGLPAVSAIFEAGADARHSYIAHLDMSTVSITSVLSSYFADSLTPLGAAVRSPCIWHVSPATAHQLSPDMQRSALEGCCCVCGRHGVSR
jgi:ankyrin repeat protein